MPASSRKPVRRYTDEHASAGLDHAFPDIETWPNQFPGYGIVIDDTEFTSVCPKTSLPDFGRIVLRYMPNKSCLELKSYKEYLFTYRNLGIFQENVVDQCFRGCGASVRFGVGRRHRKIASRGGIATTIEARYPRPKSA